MSDALRTVWEGSAHTFAKHSILETYLKAWMPIMSRQARKLGMLQAELLFVDGFAGPGRYAGGEDGSPILAIELVLSHSHDFHIPISFLFIEQDEKRRNSLNRAIALRNKRMSESQRIKCVKIEGADCEAALNGFMNSRRRANRNIGPAFFFLDQFGFSNVSMKLIHRIMSQPYCEVFSYLNWDHMNRFLTDQAKWASLDRTFGGPEWRPALKLESSERSIYMLKTYKTALGKSGGSKYVWHFAMSDSSDKLLYWLFFSTNNLRGLEEMKRAMCKVDPEGGFRFSDKDNPSQLNLFGDYGDKALAQDLSSALRGESLGLPHVREFVLTETPAYKYKTALKMLEDDGLLKVTDTPPKRRRGTFPDKYADEMQLNFVSDGLRQT
jgi:three-Cys-motif partner protein